MKSQYYPVIVFGQDVKFDIYLLIFVVIKDPLVTIGSYV